MTSPGIVSRAVRSPFCFLLHRLFGSFYASSVSPLTSFQQVGATSLQNSSTYEAGPRRETFISFSSVAGSLL